MRSQDKRKPDWSEVTLCPECGKGTPYNAGRCLLCGAVLSTDIREKRMNRMFFLEPVDNVALFKAVLRRLSDRGKVVFEGSPAEVESLRLAHLGHFVVQGQLAELSIPLTGKTIKCIVERLEEDPSMLSRVCMIQVRSKTGVQFQAADWFHPECIAVGPELPESFLRSLKDEGAIRLYCTPKRNKKIG